MEKGQRDGPPVKPACTTPKEVGTWTCNQCNPFKVVQLTIGGWDFRVAAAGCCGLNILQLQWFKGVHVKLRFPVKSASILQFQLSFYLIKFLPSNIPIATIITTRIAPSTRGVAPREASTGSRVHWAVIRNSTKLDCCCLDGLWFTASNLLIRSVCLKTWHWFISLNRSYLARPPAELSWLLRELIFICCHLHCNPPVSPCFVIRMIFLETISTRPSGIQNSVAAQQFLDSAMTSLTAVSAAFRGIWILNFTGKQRAARSVFGDQFQFESATWSKMARWVCPGNIMGKHNGTVGKPTRNHPQNPHKLVVYTMPKW